MIGKYHWMKNMEVQGSQSAEGGVTKVPHMTKKNK